MIDMPADEDDTIADAEKDDDDEGLIDQADSDSDSDKNAIKRQKRTSIVYAIFQQLQLIII